MSEVEVSLIQCNFTRIMTLDTDIHGCFFKNVSLWENVGIVPGDLVCSDFPG